MRRLQKTPASEQDLIDIGRYIESDHPNAARRLLNKFKEKFELLAEFPGMGAASGRSRRVFEPAPGEVPHFLFSTDRWRDNCARDPRCARSETYLQTPIPDRQAFRPAPSLLGRAATAQTRAGCRRACNAWKTAGKTR